MTAGPLRTKVLKKGQPYLDEPVTVHPKRVSTIEESLGKALDPNWERSRRPLLTRHERVKLNWIKPKGEK